jgi:NAD-dependent dihydropyrimidine dehydrogenase PreA subunit
MQIRRGYGMDSKLNATESGSKHPTSRRDFLKLAGAGFLGALATTTLGIAAMETSDGRRVKVWALSSGAIVHDPNLCVGCRRCETACTVRNDGKGSAYISRLKVSRNLNYGL